MKPCKYKAQIWEILHYGFGYDGIITEYRFHPDRKWRIDFALPQFKLAIEYEGIFSTKSRHTSTSGYLGDIEKYNELALMGWTLLRFTAKHVQNGMAYDHIKRALS